MSSPLALPNVATAAIAREACELVRRLEQLGAVNPAGLAACVTLLDDLLARRVRGIAIATIEASDV